MPLAAPRICPCGHRVPYGVKCACQIKRDAERKARADRARPSARERGYDSKWARARKEFLAAHPHCVMPGCGAPATVVDHIRPHRGDLRVRPRSQFERARRLTRIMTAAA